MTHNHHILKIIFSIFLFFSCERESKPLIKKSNGNINSITVVIENNLWNSDVGDAIRAGFAYPAEGLPQQEPLFDLKQMPPSVFSGFARLSRTILWVGLSEKVIIRTDTNRYATPQTMAVLTAPEKETLIEIIISQSTQIIKKLKNQEILERQRRTKKSILKQEETRNIFRVEMEIPSAYSLFKKEKKTVWFQRETQKGHLNIIITELEFLKSEDQKKTLQKIIRIRDSIGRKFIPGRLPGTHMKTEEAYTPYVFSTTIDNNEATETRGTWEVKGDFMAGPFINFLIEDKKSKKTLMIEGFVFAPSTLKRDYIFELESIIRSTRIMPNP